MSEIDLAAALRSGRATWLFDLDGCLIDAFTSTSVRPSARELLEALADREDEVHVWSTGGAGYAAGAMTRLGLRDLVGRSYAKERGRDGDWVVPSDFRGESTLIFVDDQTDGLPAGALVVEVPSYLSEHTPDDAFAAVLQTVRETLS